MTDKAQDVLASASSMFIAMHRLFAIKIEEEDTHCLTKEQLEEALRELKHNT